MAQEENKKGNSNQSSPSTPRRVFARTKNSPSFSKDKDKEKEKEKEKEKDKDDSDDTSSNSSDHYKYQTIQSFRPEEVKELLAQHFLDPTVNGRTSAPEDGIRRFSLVRTNFKQRRAFRNSRDAATLKGMVEDGEGSNGSLEEPQREPSEGELDTAHEIARLRAQLAHERMDPAHEIAKLRSQITQERNVHAKEMARMRAELRAFEAHLAQTVARMGALLEIVDARERAVQDLLAKSTQDIRVVEDETNGEATKDAGEGIKP